MEDTRFTKKLTQLGKTTKKGKVPYKYFLIVVNKIILSEDTCLPPSRQEIKLQIKNLKTLKPQGKMGFTVKY